jgi:hypothetical protein
MRIRFPIGKGRRWVALAVAFLCPVVLFAGVGLSRLKSPGGRATRIFKDTQSLEVIGLETTSNGNLFVLFKNVSSREINGFVLAIPSNGEITVDTSGGDRVISPGATEDLQIPAGSDVSDITIRAVMFADGDVEGNQTTVAQVKQRRSALKRELKRGLALVRNAADSPDAGTAAALDKLEFAISNLTSDPASEISSRDGGLHDAKEDLITAIRALRDRQEHNGFLKQRERLQELRDRIERRIASL